MNVQKICTLFILTFVCAAIATAQDEKPRIIAALTNADYPYERGQWTKEQGDAWSQKYGPIIGVNCPYPPCDAITQEEAIKKAAALGFNSIRWWPSGSTASDYISSVESWAAMAEKYGMTVSPVFGFFHSYAAMSNEENGLKTLESVVRQVIRHFRDDERIVLWDIANEPEMNDSATCIKHMEWIQKMVEWCRQEGCTQPISSSIIWDANISAAGVSNTLIAKRNETEAMMDVHNFHDYAVQEDHNRNISVMVTRIGRIDDRPLVCTECLTRTDGSGVARSLTEFAKYNIHFYTWGLYSCDANWEVSWGRSTYYAWEPMFHNLLYADGDPYNPAELDFIKNFTFSTYGTSTDPGAEYTERWTKRRAWKWMSGAPVKGLTASSISEALSLVAEHAADSLYNSISVSLGYSGYQSGSSAFYNNLTALLEKAKTAGMTVLPTLLSDADLSNSNLNLANYIYNTIDKYYNDARIRGWNLITQSASTDESKLQSLLPYLFRYVRYAFPNQPIFATPLVSSATNPDSTATDITNTMWQLSDVVAYNTASGVTVTDELLDALYTVYNRPTFVIGTATLQNEYAPHHVNWYAANAFSSADVAAFAFTPLSAPYDDRTERMEGWQAYAQMNRVPTKGLSYNSVSAALTGVTNNAASGLYNSVQVLLDFDTYYRNTEKFFSNFDSLLTIAGNAGMTVLPALLSDKYALRSQTALVAYVEEMIERYDKDERIIAWDLYYKPCTQSIDKDKVAALLPVLFSTARSKHNVKPVFATPTVSVSSFSSDYDYIDDLVHGGTTAGWNKFSYGNSSVSLCYLAWSLSDVIAYVSSQDSPELGWLNSVAYRFGRPLLCTKWTVSKSEDPSKVLDVFRNMHVYWYADGTPGDDNVRNFDFDPIITNH